MASGWLIIAVQGISDMYPGFPTRTPQFELEPNRSSRPGTDGLTLLKSFEPCMIRAPGLSVDFFPLPSLALDMILKCPKRSSQSKATATRTWRRRSHRHSLLLS